MTKYTSTPMDTLLRDAGVSATLGESIKAGEFTLQRITLAKGNRSLNGILQHMGKDGFRLFLDTPGNLLKGNGDE